MMRAQDQIPWQNLRQRRAEMLAAMVMNCLDRFICDHGEDNARKYCSRELLHLFTVVGVEVITDFDRTNAGLSLRNRDGYTVEELQILETHRAAVMLGPIPGMKLP